jgi:hypothetical protein
MALAGEEKEGDPYGGGAHRIPPARLANLLEALAREHSARTLDTLEGQHPQAGDAMETNTEGSRP